MNFYDLIEKRESIRDYDSSKQIPEDVLKRILNAGRLAPSAANRQPWTFIVVKSAEKLDAIHQCYGREWYKNAPYVLVVKGYKDASWVRSNDGYNALETDLTIAMDHMILAAEYEGVATCWIAAFDPEKIRAALALKDNEEVYAITPLGYPNDGFKKRAQKSRKALDEVVEFI